MSTRSTILIAVTLLILTAPLAGQFTVTEVARVGDPVPVPAGGVIESLQPWSPIPARVDSSGRVAFAAKIPNPAGASLDGIYLWEAGVLTAVAVTFEPTPYSGPCPGPDCSTWGPLVWDFDISDAGVAFAAQSIGSAVSPSSGIFLFSGGTVTPQIEAEQATPIPGMVFYSVSGVAINDAGDLAFYAWYYDGTAGAVDGYGYFARIGGTLFTVAVGGQPVGGVPGATYTNSPYLSPYPSISDTGIVSFPADIDTAGGVVGGIFRWSAGIDSPIALEGDIAPVSGSPYDFFYPGPVSVDALGDAVFHSNVGSLGNHLYLDSGGVDSLLVGGSDPAPSPATQFNGFSGPPVRNDTGSTVFRASTLGGAGGLGLFVDRPTGIETIVTFDDPAPGGGTFVTVSVPDTNDLEQTAFQSTVSIPGNLTEGIYLATLPPPPPPPAPDFQRGDATSDTIFGIGDPVAILGYLFAFTPLGCLNAADCDDNEVVNVADAIYALSALFLVGSPQPPAPHPGCGADPTPGPLTCLTPICP